MARKAGDWKGQFAKFLTAYRFQPELTSRLDGLTTEPFDQGRINEIVLWKVNRFVDCDDPVLAELNRVLEIPPRKHRDSEAALELLLGLHGADLAMASTLLRFRNRAAFQIIDRHAYRALYGRSYRLYSSSPTAAKVTTYFQYLDDLWRLADQKGLEFSTLDRLLYVFDQEENGKLD